MKTAMTPSPKEKLRYSVKSRHCGFEGSIGMATSRVTEYFLCPGEQVWPTITDLTNTAWRSDLAQVEILDENHFVEPAQRG